MATSPTNPPRRTSRPVTRDIDVFGLTHQGRVRDNNQDHFLIGSLHKLLNVHQTSLPEPDLKELVSETRGYLFLVADGVGGRPAGAEASHMVLRTVAEHVTHLMDLYRRVDSQLETVFLQELTKSVERSHLLLRQQGEEEYGEHTPATTLVMVAVLWPRAYMVQVGDSRCYRLRDGELERLSMDQTVAQALLESGALTPEEAEQSPLRSVLASAVGGPEATPVTASADCQWEDVMLLCTDGLTEHVTEAEIAEELRRIETAEQSCQRLIGLALERGGTDNVTVVIGRLRPRRGSGAR